MPKVAQPGDFFVVGGPVQPDRACYVERAADAELLRGIGEQRFCYVLAARSTGKSSLVARAIRSLRRDGQLAAVVDLSQIAAHTETGAATRWYYAIAYRVLRELRLKFDLQGWWQEKSALAGEQRLAEFFFEVVLTHTSVPVTVFIDEIERTLALPFAQDLFATIHSCYARRVSDPDYGRLNFVVLGVASPAALCPDTGISPFMDGVAIEPADFTLEQSLTLAPGFGAEAASARAVLERIHEWSGGQPYLTQRLARGVARKGGRVEDVDRVVREQFLAPGAAEKDPYLGQIRLLLTRRGAKQRQALAVLGKLTRGAAVSELPLSAPKDVLRLGGITTSGADGRLRYRNRILREVFDERWLSGVRPFEWRRAGGIAALVAVAIAVPVWYAQVLPRPYVHVLASDTTDLAAVEEAHGKLHRLPGFAGKADRLLADAMARHSESAERYSDVIAADRVLRRLPGQETLADRLAADYWLRRANDAMHVERREAAVVLALEALPAGGLDARRLLAELIGADLGRLRETLRFASPPLGWAIDWEARRLSVVDGAAHARRVVFAAANGDTEVSPAAAGIDVGRETPPGTAVGARPGAALRVVALPDELQRIETRAGGPLESAAADAPLESVPAGDGGRSREAAVDANDAASPLQLTSLLHVPLQREIGVDEPGLAGAFRLDIRVGHERTQDLSFVLTAPGGAEARLTLEGRDPSDRSYSFRALDASPLTALSGAERRGVWRLTVVDRRAGAKGTLIDWSLSFAGTPWAWRDAPPQPLDIPDPRRTDQVEVVLGAGGRLAATRPARQGALGSLAIWDLAEQRLLHDVEIGASPDFVAFNGDGSRLVVRAGDALSFWDVAGGRRIARLEARNGFSLPPAMSVDGDFVALAEGAGLDLVRVADGTLVATAPAVTGARAWVVGAAARYAAIVESNARTVRVIDPRRADAERRLHHEQDVQRLIPAPTGDWLLTVDALGDVRAWRIPIDIARSGPVDAFRLGATVDANSVSVSANGTLVAFAAPHGHVVVRDLVEESAVVHLAIGSGGGRIDTRLGPDGRTLATVQGDELRLWDVESGRAAAASDPNLAALAIDAGGAVAALGFRAGHVRVRSASELSRPEPRPDTIDYIGHRGRVTSVDINAPRALIASGGANGLVRVWDLASVAPTKHFMRHPAGPVEAVALSADGAWVASAADQLARLWRIDGTLVGEVIVNGTALSVELAPDSTRWAIGDSAGNVFVATTGGAKVEGSVRAQGPVRALAFSPAGGIIASGDDTGHVELWDAATFASIGERRAFAHPVRWLGFSSDGAALLIQTERFIHRAVVENGRIDVRSSRMLPAGVAAGAALAAADASAVRLVGGLGAGAVAFHDVSLSMPAVAAVPENSPLLARDWRRALGLEIDSDGAVVTAAN